MEDHVARAHSCMYRSKRILDASSNQNSVQSSSSLVGRFRTANSFAYSSYSYSSSSSALDSSLKLSLKPKIVPNKNIFDSND